MRSRVRPEHIVVGICSFRNYSGFRENVLQEQLSDLSKDHPILADAGIITDPIHRDSRSLHNGIWELYSRGVLGVELPEGMMRFREPFNPQAYFNDFVKGDLEPRQTEAIRRLAEALP